MTDFIVRTSEDLQVFLRPLSDEAQIFVAEQAPELERHGRELLVDGGHLATVIGRIQAAKMVWSVEGGY